jgi:hypothetical protein
MDNIPGWLFVQDILRAIWGSLTLDPAVFEIVLDARRAWVISLTVLVLAAASHFIGQTVVLQINGVPRASRLKALALGSLQQIGGFFLWMFAIWLIATVIFRADQDLTVAFRVLAIAYAPMVLGFVVLVPFAGPWLFQGLRMWTVLAVIVATSVAFAMSPRAAAICAIVGWIGQYFLTQLIGRFSRTDNPSMASAAATSARLRLLAERERQRGGAR